MTAAQRALILIAHAPALTDHDDRPAAIVHAMERTFPGLRLGWTTSEKEDLIALPHRDEWVAANMTNGGFPFLCNDDDDHLVTVAGLENPNGLAAGSPPHFEVHADLPLNAAGIAAAADVLEGVAEGARAVWGHATPSGYGWVVAQQFRHPGDEQHVPPHGLPALELPWNRSKPEIPHFLGWLNYWSAAAARALGFPDPSRDAELFSQARRTATGGWVVRLDVWGVDVWAVGNAGKAFHWDGTAWTEVSSGLAVNLYSVRGDTAGKVWATGDNGLVLRWTGSGWATEKTGTLKPLYGLAPLGDAGLLVVGQDGAVLRQRP